MTFDTETEPYWGAAWTDKILIKTNVPNNMTIRLAASSIVKHHF